MAHSTAYQICFMIVSFVAVWIFASFIYIVMRHIMFNPARLKKYHIHKPMLYLTTMVWVTLVLRNITQAFLLNNLIFPFQNDCDDDSTCLQCHVTGKLSILLLIISYGFILSVFANALKANFMPLCSNRFYCKLKFYTMQFWIIGITCAGIIQSLSDSDTNFEVIQLSDNSSKYICRRKRYLTDSNVFARILLCLASITQLMIILIFLVKSYRLLKKTSIQISKMEIVNSNSIIQVRAVMDSVVKHTIISVAVLLSPVTFLIIPYFINEDIDLNPCAEITSGICLYMLFRFGKKKYKMIFGCIHTKILNIWGKGFKILTTDAPTRRTSDINPNPAREQRLSSVLPPVSTASSLPTIQEESLEKKAEEILHMIDIDIGDPL